MREVLSKVSAVLGSIHLVTASYGVITQASEFINDNFLLIWILGVIYFIPPLWPDRERRRPGPVFDESSDKSATSRLFSNAIKYRWVILVSTSFMLVAIFWYYPILYPWIFPDKLENRDNPTAEPPPTTGEGQDQINTPNEDEFRSSGSGSRGVPNSSFFDQSRGHNNASVQIVQQEALIQPVNGMVAEAPILSNFKLNSIKTSFIETNQGFGGEADAASYRTFKLNPDIYDVTASFKSGSPKCMCGWESQDYDRTADALKRYTDITGEQHLKKYLSTFVWMEFLPQKYPDVAQQLIPRINEWGKLSPSDYNTILRWVKCCIGIPYPTFLISIRNPNETELIIQKIKFNVKDIDQIKPIEEGIEGPKATYVFQLDYKIGSQVKDLPLGGFKIPAKKTSTFEVQLFTNHPEAGLCWLMNMEFITDVGNCSTKDFQLIMSGKSLWSQGQFK